MYAWREIVRGTRKNLLKLKIRRIRRCVIGIINLKDMEVLPMNYQTHLVGGIACGIGACYAATSLNLDYSFLYLIGGAALGALMPDIDHPQSFLGNKVTVLSELIYTTVGHRSLTHSLVFAFVLAITLGLFSVSLGIGAAVGILSHIALDMLTPAGVALLYPFRKKRIRLF